MQNSLQAMKVEDDFFTHRQRDRKHWPGLYHELQFIDIEAKDLTGGFILQRPNSSLKLSILYIHEKIPLSQTYRSQEIVPTAVTLYSARKLLIWICRNQTEKIKASSHNIIIFY